MLRRFGFFMMLNVGVMVVISLVVNLLGFNAYLTSSGIDYPTLFAFSLVVGFAGSLISLFLSKSMAIRAYRIRLIENPQRETEHWLYETVARFAGKSGLPMPAVGVYQSPEPNAFATGASKRSSLIAVSTGLLGGMKRNEVEAVLAHEVGHVANGDMVTMTLLQGVLNTFVVFFARIVAFFVGNMLSRDREGGSNPFLYMAVSFVMEICFGFLAQIIAMWFSRQREYRADAFAARLSGKADMIAALQRLNGFVGKTVDVRNPETAAFKISNNRKLMSLFASHPPIPSRIQSLQNL